MRVLCFLFFSPQFEGYNIHLSSAVYLRPGPNHRLVRFAGRVPALERSQEAKTSWRTFRSDTYVFKFDWKQNTSFLIFVFVLFFLKLGSHSSSNDTLDSLDRPDTLDS